jgi:hypothetical protein
MAEQNTDSVAPTFGHEFSLTPFLSSLTVSNDDDNMELTRSSDTTIVDASGGRNKTTVTLSSTGARFWTLPTDILGELALLLSYSDGVSLIRSCRAWYLTITSCDTWWHSWFIRVWPTQLIWCSQNHPASVQHNFRQLFQTRMGLWKKGVLYFCSNCRCDYFGNKGYQKRATAIDHTTERCQSRLSARPRFINASIAAAATAAAATVAAATAATSVRGNSSIMSAIRKHQQNSIVKGRHDLAGATPKAGHRHHCIAAGCTRSFRRPAELRRHMQTHATERTLIYCHHMDCRLSSKSRPTPTIRCYKSTRSFSRHLRSVHGSDVSYMTTCPLNKDVAAGNHCSVSEFASMEELQTHLRKVHSLC